MKKSQHCRSPILFCALFLILNISSSAIAFNYSDALTKSLLYFEAQRSGRLPYNQRITWRDDSGLTDGLEQGVDLVGGYYDAGDHVKFGLPMAFTITVLSWTVIEFHDDIAAAGELHHALDAIKWGTDYFIKAHAEPNLLWAEVGDGDTDHYCWQRPEDMTTSRRAYKIDENNPGSDLAGETAAAMAAASIVFRGVSPPYSRLLVRHAKQLLGFANKHRGKYDTNVSVAKSYYSSFSGYMDELLWGSMWLYLATNRDEHLKYVIDNAVFFGGTGWAMKEFSWDVKYAGLQVLISKVLLQEKYRESVHVMEEYRKKAEHYVCSCINRNNGGNVELTPGGLLYVREWNNMQYVATSSFLLAVYADLLRDSNQKLNCSVGLVDHNEILKFCKSQVDYILGSNPMNMSYLVGHGPNYPTQVHHRGASMVSYKEFKGFIGCTQGYDNWYHRKAENPNVLVGALVGGPDFQDRFVDHRDNYKQTEACTYNTAPLVGVFAMLSRMENRKTSKPMHLVASY